jgi:HPt (histidine-containing phosphotransfer) domain-containing protein
MSEVLDAVVLADLIEHIGDEAARAVIELFIGECRDLTAAMMAAPGDRVAVGRAAHSLKSSAGQLGAVALSEAALAVEDAAESGSPALPELIAALARCAAATEVGLARRPKS